MADANYQESSSGAPDWYNNMFQNLLKSGQTQARDLTFNPYTGQRVAGFTPQQNSAFNLASNNVGNWQQNVNQGAGLLNQAGAYGNLAGAQTAGGLNAFQQALAGGNQLGGAGAGAMSMFGQIGGQDYMNPANSSMGQYGQLGSAAQGLLGQNQQAADNFGLFAQQGMQQGNQNLGTAATGYENLMQQGNQFNGAGNQSLQAYQQAQKSAQYNPNQLNQYLDPYRQGVVNEIARLGNKNFNEVLAPSINDQYGGLGQYGSARQALALGKAAGDTATGIAGQQAQALSNSYNNAMNAYQGFAGMGANTGLSAGAGYGNLANMGINAQQAGAAGLSGIGQNYLNTGLQGAQGQQSAGTAGMQGLSNAASGLSSLGNWQGNLALGGAQGLSGLNSQYLNNLQGVGSGLSNMGQWGTSANIQSGNALGNLGQTRSQLGIADYGTLFNAGQAQQQLNQNQLDVGYNNWQQAQQYPWQQLQNYGGLFGSANPSQSSSWSTQLKKGGLVRLAEGGRFREDSTEEDFTPWEVINQRTRDGQAERDRLGLELRLRRELPDYPNDPALLSEITRMGGTIPPVQTSRDEQDIPDLIGQTLAQAPNVGNRNAGNALLEELFAASKGSFPQRERPTELQKVGRALLESSAMGPANYGQILGRAGAAYFGNEDALAKTNEAQDASRLEYQERLAEAMGRNSRTGGGGVKLFRGKDGSQWGLDSGTGEKFLLYPGSYDEKINSLAVDAAKKSLDQEGLVFHSADEYRQALESRIQSFRQQIAAGFAGLGATVNASGQQQMPPPGNAPAQRPMTQPEGIGVPPANPPGIPPKLGGVTAQGQPPAGVFTGDLEKAKAEIQAISDPTERAAAMKAFEASQTTTPPLFTIPKIKQDEPGTIVPRTVQKAREYEETAASKYYNEEFMPAVESAQGLAQASKQLLAMNLPFGKLANVKELLGGVAEALHIDSTVVDQAARLQTARPILKEMQNAVMLAAKGVQTEGDAQRAIDQFVRLDDTPQAAKQIARIAEATGYMADLANRYSQQYASENNDQMRGMRSSWNSYRKQNLPMFKINPKTKKPIYLNEWVKAVQNKGGSEAEALRDWASLS